MTTMLDVINGIIAKEQEVEEKEELTKEEFGKAIKYGSEEEKLEAVERMQAAGGYENLKDE